MATLLAFALLLAACNGDGGVTGGTSSTGSTPEDDVVEDTTAPEFVEASPTAQSSIGTGATLRITFSEPLSESSVALGASLGEVAEFALETAEDGSGVVVITPQSAWPAGEQTLELDGADEAGNALATLTVEWVVDNVPPEASADVEDGDVINEDRAIVISFTNADSDLLEAVDPDSLELSGTLVDSGDGAESTWSSSNAKLTLSPTSVWPAGAELTLVVDVTDLQGNALDSLSLTLPVLAGAVYVDTTSGDDENLGSAEAPLQTLHAGVALAESIFSTSGQIRVAEGTYTLDATTGPLELTGPATLAGGFDPADWAAEPDPVAHTTTITNADTLDGGGKMVVLWAPETDYPAGLRGVTLVETQGDIITVYAQAGTLDTITVTGGVVGVVITGAVTLRDSLVLPDDYLGVRVADLMEDGAALLERNRIQGGDNDGGDGSVGVEILGAASPVLRNNLISAGTGTDPAPFGIWFNAAASSAAVLTNNTVYGSTYSGIGSEIAAAISGDSAADLRNNLLVTEADGVCVDGSVGVLRNNDLWGCAAGYYEDVADLDSTLVVTGEGSTDTLEDLGNVSLNPMAADLFSDDLTDAIDWQPATTAHCNVRFGGQNLSADYVDDEDETLRTAVTNGADNADAAGWTMGAVEQDGGADCL